MIGRACTTYLEALDWIAKAIAGRMEADFLSDDTLCYAVAQKLTIIGEAVARLSPELTARHNSVPWTDIVGLRNIRFTSTSVSIGPLSGKLPLTMPRSDVAKSRKSSASSGRSKPLLRPAVQRRPATTSGDT